MAVRKPLVFNTTTGKIQELPAGDAIQEAVIGFSGTNQTGVGIVKGSPVYKNATTDRIELADATDNTKQCVGFASELIADTASGVIQTNDTINLADWTTILGSATLTPGTVYFLDSTAGQIVADVSTFVAGNVVQKVGVAVSTTDLLIQLGDPIELS